MLHRAVFTWLSKGIGFGFGFGFTTPFGWLVYLLWFWFYDSQVKTALLLIVKTDLLTVQVVWSRWLDICLVIFCVFYSVTSTNKNAKKNLADIQLSWPHTWSIMILSFLQMTARALPYLEEDERLLPKLTNLRFVLLARCNTITLSGEFCCLVCDDLLVFFRYDVFNILVVSMLDRITPRKSLREGKSLWIKLMGWVYTAFWVKLVS